MNLHTPTPLLLAAALLACAPHAAAQSARVKAFPETRWEQLVPSHWDPAKVLDGVDVAGLKDGDSKTAHLWQRLREAWDKAPVDAALDGKRTRIGGYVVPLEAGKAGLTEFLLVPYFGACIHTPPPPANQIVHVTLRSPLKDIRSMDAVWAAGTLRAVRTGSAMGVSGYRLDVDAVEPYAPGR